MPITFSPIQSVTLSSASSTITFSNIPTTYTDLILRFSARSSVSNERYDFSFMTFNGDTASNYSWTRLETSGNTPTSSTFGSMTSIQTGPFPAGLTTANTFGSCEVMIANYAGTANKPVYVDNRQENNDATAGTWRINAHAGLYRSSSAISSITLTAWSTISGQFGIGSTFHLYGIKKD